MLALLIKKSTLATCFKPEKERVVVTKKPRYFKSYANDLLMRLLIFGKDELLKEGQFWGFKEFLGKRVGNEVFCFSVKR